MRQYCTWLAIWMLAGCAIPGKKSHATKHLPAATAAHSDRDDDLKAFRQGLTPVDTLASGESSRDALVRRFVTALATRDTAALGLMVLSRAEFAYVYYPTNPQSQAPYDLHASLMWFMLSRRSEVGAQRLLEARAGRAMRFVSVTCDPVPSREGANTVWGPCGVRYAGEHGDTTTERLFGLIIEHGGRYKFVSYSNKLD